MYCVRRVHGGWIVLFLGLSALCATPRANEKSLERRVEELLTQEGRVLVALDALDQKVHALREKRDALRTQSAALRTDLDDVNQSLKAARLALETVQSRLQKRLKIRSNLDVEQAHRRRLLFADGGQTDWLRRRGYLAAIVKDDLTLIRHHRRLDEQLGVSVAQRKSVLDALRVREERLAQEQAAYEGEKELRRAALLALKKRQALLRTLLRQQAQRRGNLAMVSAAKGGLRGDDILEQRGLLSHPTAHRIVRRFGLIKDPQTGTSLQSNGWTYRGPLGAPIQAIFSGVVVYSGWYTGFGQLLLIDHGQGHHSLYAHLDKLTREKGDRVQAGDLVGYLGDTGSLRGPQLYFELRQDRKPINPARWLMRRP